MGRKRTGGVAPEAPPEVEVFEASLERDGGVRRGRSISVNDAVRLR